MQFSSPSIVGGSQTEDILASFGDEGKRPRTQA
jgi:hypothetical protein